jgi:hypothetical protein
MGRTCSKHGRDEQLFTILVLKPEGKSSLARLALVTVTEWYITEV